MKHTIANIYMSSTKYPWWNLNARFWKTRFEKFLNELSKSVGYKTKCVDPFELEDSDSSDVVLLDKFAIHDCDYFVCYLNKLSIGTIMELMHHYCINNYKGIEKDYPSKCLLIDPSGKHRNHPWIKYHCRYIFDNVEDAAIFIHEDMIKPKEEFSL